METILQVIMLFQPGMDQGMERDPGGSGGGSSDEGQAGPGFRGWGFPRRPAGDGDDPGSSDDKDFGSIPSSMSIRRSTRRREETRMMKRMLEQCLVEVFEAGRIALEEPPTNIGP